MKILVERLQLAPTDIVYRGIVDKHKKQLLKDFKSMSFTRLRVPIVVVPIVGLGENDQHIYPSRAKQVEEIMDGQFG